MPDTAAQEIILKGIGASPGICMGKAYLVDKQGVEVVKKYYITPSQIPDEVKRFKSAVKKAEGELHAIIKETPGNFRDHTSILETHVILLKDKMLYGKTIETIEDDKINAEWALRKVVAEIKAIFKSMQDTYFRDRADDISHVSDRIMRNLMGADPINIKDIDKRVILVAHDLSPAETSQIQLERVMGFVTDTGGMTSHTGIIARTLEIPAVMGSDHATGLIHNDDFVIVDGSSGEVVIHPAGETLVYYVQRRVQYEARRKAIIRKSQTPAKTADGITIQIMGNIELPEEVVSVRDHGGDGIGLYRTEFQYLSRPDFPSENELYDKYKDVVEVMAPKPVIIRTLDVNGDKALANGSAGNEVNPALGLRGIRYCLKKRDVFRTQLRAILRAAACGHVKILFPMISGYDEICEAGKMLDDAAESLEKEGIPYNREIEVGIMIEVPSAVIIADIMADAVDFFSIGTNDLIQYALAIDREDKHVAHLYQPLHPAIIRMIKQVSEVAKEKGKKISMCGEMAAYPMCIPILLGIGLDELSMNPQSIPVIKNIIRAVELENMTSFIHEVLKQTTAEAVEVLIKSRFGDVISERSQ